MKIEAYPRMLRAALALFVSITTGIGALHADPAAFPGAEGFGAIATGGRGGTVYIVTNLNDSGAGSFRDAVSASNRIVVFAVGGVINLKSDVVVSSNITIAGQTAPGDGIAIYGSQVGFKSNVICRYVRIHGSINMDSSDYTLSAAGVDKGIFDHVSVLWGRWDNMKLDGSSNNITFQYCLVGEAILPQNLGALFETAKNVTVHHSLWLNNKSRNPKAKSNIQYINNVVYNWGSDGFVGGHSSAHFYQDLISNYFMAGPSSGSGNGFISQMGSTDHLYHTGNYVDKNANGTLDGTLLADGAAVSGAALSSAPYFSGSSAPVTPVTLDTAPVALQKVIAKAGASDRRDAADIRLINQVKSYGTLGGLVQRESDVGGQPAMAGGIAPKDTNSTGIPDWWAEAMGLGTPADAAYANTVRPDGYTNLEYYVNSIVTAGEPSAVITGITLTAGASATDPVTRGSITKETNIKITGTAAPNATVSVSRVDTGVLGTATANASGVWTYDYSGTTLANRYYAFTARVGTAVTSAAYAVRVKTTASAAPVISYLVTGASKTFTGTADPYSTITVRLSGGADVATATADGLGNWTTTTTASLSGLLTFLATSTDLAGLTTADSAPYVVDMGIAPPVFTGVTPDTGSLATDQITSSQALTFAGTAPASATVKVYIQGTAAAIGTVTADAGGAWSLDYTATTLPAGKHTLLATAENGGTPSPRSEPFIVTIDRTAPTVSSIRRSVPDTASTASGTLVFRVTFAEPVSGVAQSQFSLTKGVGVAGNITDFVQINDTTCDVTVTGASGDNTIRLDLPATATAIKDLAGNSYGAAYTSGQTYTMRYVGSGVWNTDESGVWSGTSAWDGGIIAGGIGATADFSTVDIDDETVVTLDSPRTLGRMIFADADEESAGNWRIATSGAGVSITLANPAGAQPEVRVAYETIPEGGAQNYDKSTGGAAVPVVIDATVTSTAGLYKTGWGSLIINNTGTFSGAINVEQGRVTFGEGARVSLGSGEALTIGTTGGGGGQFIINGGTFSTLANTTIPYATLNVLELKKGKADFKNISTTGDGGGLIKISGGSFTAGDVNIGRTAGATGDWSHGFVVSGGTATVANLGIATNNSWACGSVEGGKLIVSGVLRVGVQTTGTRGGQFRVQGGGELVAGEIILSGSNNNITTFDITNGTVTTSRLTFGAASVTSGTSTFTLNGASAALYLGEDGITKPGTFTTTINLTNGTLGADASWSTTHPMVVTGAGNVTIKAANATGAARDITLGGVLSGSGTMTKTGAGTLSLTALNTHTGPITVNAGTLNVTGRIANGTEVVTINAGATLAGTGTIGRPVVLNGGSLVAGAAPLAVTSLTKQGTGKVPVTYAPAAAGSSRTTIVTYTSSNLTNNDFEPTVANGQLIYMDVTATGIDQVVADLAAAGGDSGVTGGGNSATTIVTTAAAFKTALESAAPAIVVVNGEIDISSLGALAVAPNKTILGQSAASTIKGSLKLSATTSNIVIKGLNITNPAGNGLVIDGAQDVYVTHCSFYDCNGPLVSAINGAGDITLAWNEFYYTSGFAGARSAMKIGAGATETEPLHIVLHHNYFGDRCAADMPVSNYGYVHMYDNFLHAPGNTTATIVGPLSQMLSAHNVYKDMADPIVKNNLGLLAAVKNTYGTGTAAAGDDKVFVPAGQYVLETAASVGTRVPAYAGNTGGAGSPTPETVAGAVSISGPDAPVPSGGTLMLAANVTGATPVSYQWNLDNKAVTGATNSTYGVASARADTHAGAYSVSVGLGTGETIVSGSLIVRIGANNLPVIVTQPISLSVRTGERAVFGVVATSDTPLKYQWKKDGVIIPFATMSAYYVDAADAINAGKYQVVLTNDAGTVNSDMVALVLADAPSGNTGGGSGGGGGGAPSWWLLGAAALLMITRYARKIRGLACIAALFFAGIFATTDVSAQTDGTWSNASGGNWSAAGNWTGGAVASGAGSTASFTNAGDKTVTVDAPVTVGNITFSTASWTIASSGASSTLTLEVATGAPVIDVGATTDTISASLSGTMGFTKSGSGNLILTGSSTITGGIVMAASASTAPSGTLRIASGGYLDIGADNVRIAGGANSVFEIAGGTFRTTGTVITGTIKNNTSRMVVSSGYANIGEFRTNSDSGSTLLVTGGTLDVGYINILRATSSATNYTTGVIVQGGHINAGNIGIGTQASYAAMSVESGTVLVTGTFVVAWNDSVNGRGSSLRVTGGRLTSTSVDGLILSKSTTTSTTGTSPLSLLSISGGVATMEKITMGQGTYTAVSTSTIALSGGALYIGTGGIVTDSNINTNITLSGGTLGAKGTWSTTLPITVSGAATILAASEAGVANDITLDGVVSGAGAITKDGAGTLTLSAANTHTGAITVNTGTLAITGGIGAGAGEITVNDGAALVAAGLNLGRPLTLAGGSTIVLNGTPTAVTTLSKTGSGQIQIIFNGTFTDKMAIATFDTATVENSDFAPVTLSNGSQVFVKVSAGRLELVTTLFTVPNLPEGITGSDGASPSAPATAAALKTALESAAAATIYVNGTIDLSTVGGVINVGPNKTIVGQNAASTISGQLHLPATSGNVVIFGVNIANPEGNGLVIDGAQNVYVTQCTFFDCNGALVSAINGADNITITWSEFYYTTAFPGARSVMKIGSAGAESDPLHVVLHHNYFGEGCTADMPVSNNGYIHMYDNYLRAPGNTTATIVSANSQMLSEGNVYQDMAAPIAKNSGGLVRVIHNTYVDTTGTAQGGADAVFVPDYSRVLETAEAIGTDVPLFAGNYAGINSLPPDDAVTAQAAIMATGTVVPVGGNFTLLGSVSGYQPQSYQWYLNNLPIAGATSSGYTVANATPNHSGPYSVGATLATGDVVMSGATHVTVGAGHGPVIVKQPISLVVAEQETAVFTVVATGDAVLKYQWQKDGENVAGQTRSMFQLPANTTNAGASYRVIITNDYGTVTSDVVTLTLRPGSGGGDSGGGGGGAPSWWLFGALAALATLRAITTRRR